MAFRFGVTPRTPFEPLARERLTALTLDGFQALDLPELLVLGFDIKSLTRLRQLATVLSEPSAEETPAGPFPPDTARPSVGPLGGENAGAADRAAIRAPVPDRPVEDVKTSAGPSGGLTADMLTAYEAAVHHALLSVLRSYRITAAISRRDEQGHKARKALTADVATHLFGHKSGLSTELRRGFGPLIVKLLRELFKRWVDELGPRPSDVIEVVNDHSIVFPEMVNPDEWRAVARVCLTLQTTDPVRGHAVALREYAGFSTRDIGTILGITHEEVATYVQVDVGVIVSPAQ